MTTNSVRSHSPSRKAVSGFTSACKRKRNVIICVGATDDIPPCSSAKTTKTCRHFAALFQLENRPSPVRTHIREFYLIAKTLPHDPPQRGTLPLSAWQCRRHPARKCLVHSASTAAAVLHITLPVPNSQIGGINPYSSH